MTVVMKGLRNTANEAEVDLVAYPILTEEVGYPPSPMATKGAQQLAFQHIQCRFVDENNKPFVGRRVAVLLPNGDEIEIETDEQGYFEAPQGSRVYARQDQWGLAAEPIVVSEGL
jgi:hypothetical protein